MANFNYFAHRQFYINGLTQFMQGEPELQDKETAVTEALRQLSPVYKFEGIRPLPIYFRGVEEVHGQSGNVIDTVTVTKCNIFAFRNGEEIYKKANAYFNKVGNPQWSQGNCALVSVSDWGLKTDRLEGDYEFFIFDNNGFLLNNSYNTFVVSITGVLYFVMSNCESWHGMYGVATDETLDFTKSISEGNFYVDVVAIRKEAVPYAVVPKCSAEEFYDESCTTTEQTDTIPGSFAAEWDKTKETGWGGCELDNYGIFVTLGNDIEITGTDVQLGLDPNWDTYFNGLATQAEKDSFLGTIAARINTLMENSKGLNFEISNEVYDVVREGGSLVFTTEATKRVKDLGIKITVPVDAEILEAQNAYEGGFTFTLQSLPKDSRFYVSSRSVQFDDEIRMWKDNGDIKISSKAYPAGLGQPFFDKTNGLAYIPLAKYTGTIADYNGGIAADSSPSVMKDYEMNQAVYQALGGFAGSHAYPLLTPKAEDVMIFVGNRKGMIKLTPYVDYTIEKSGSPITGNMPAIMLMGRVPANAMENDGDDTVANGPLTALQLRFPKPEGSDNPQQESTEDNADIFIRIFVGYRRNKISSYWGPLPNHLPEVSATPTDDANIAVHGFSVENTVEKANENKYVFGSSDLKMVSVAEMTDSDSEDRAIPWSILPRECFLEFDAGRYSKCCNNYTNRILQDRVFALTTDRPRDVELHALISNKFGMADALRKSTADELPYFDSILEKIIGTGLETEFITATANAPTPSSRSFDVDAAHTPTGVNNHEAFAYVSGIAPATQITEAINAAMWQTWFATVDDDTDEAVYGSNS